MEEDRENAVSLGKNVPYWLWVLSGCRLRRHQKSGRVKSTINGTKKNSITIFTGNAEIRGSVTLNILCRRHPFPKRTG